MSDSSPNLCPFCAVPTDRIVEVRQHAFAVLDAHPVSPGHTPAIARRHVPDAFDLTADEVGDILYLIRSARDRIDRTLRPTGYNIGNRMVLPGGARARRGHGDRYATPADSNRPPLSAHHRACVSHPTDGLGPRRSRPTFIDGAGWRGAGGRPGKSAVCRFLVPDGLVQGQTALSRIKLLFLWMKVFTCTSLKPISLRTIAFMSQRIFSAA